MDLDPKTDLHFTRSLAVPRALVWECWTSPEHITFLHNAVAPGDGLRH